MTGLAEWLERQRRPLPFSLWLELSMGVARIDALIKQEHFSEARVALAALTATARQHNLPAWGALLHLLESSLTLAANGDLGRTLDLAFRALTTVEKLADPTHRPLQLCARLAVARCWLKMDEIGYAPDVARLIHTTLAEGDTGEWWFWYQASLAWALWALNHHEEADSILTRMLADFPGWMARPDQIEARAYIAYRMRRLLDAAQYYGECAAAFEAEGQRYAGVRCELNRALCLNEAGAYDRSIEVLEAIRAQTLHLENRHYPGLFYCLCGRNAFAAGEYEHAAADLGESLDYYEGRGWLRDEARIAIERLEALHHLGDHPDWRSLAGKARARVARLRSTDLQARLEKIVDGWTSGRAGARDDAQHRTMHSIVLPRPCNRLAASAGRRRDRSDGGLRPGRLGGVDHVHDEHHITQPQQVFVFEGGGDASPGAHAVDGRAVGAALIDHE